MTEAVEVRVQPLRLAELLRWRIERWEADARFAGVDIGRGGQAAVARLAGIGKGTLNNLITGDQHISVDTAVRLGPILGVDPQVLMAVDLQALLAESEAARVRWPLDRSEPVGD